MTIDEAISHAREVAENDGCTNCAKEHEQLAEWLEELKVFRNTREHKKMSDTVTMPATVDEWQRDMNLAYEQGREDTLAEILKLPRLDRYDMWNELMYQSIRVDDIERLRKPREDSQETEPDNVILQDFFKGDSQ